MPTSQIFTSVRHDTASSPEPVFTPPDNVTFNLQEAGLVLRFVARLPGASVPKISGVAVVTGPWSARYDPTAADVDTIGLYDVQCEATRSNGKKLTLPTADVTDSTDAGRMYWRIITDLDNV